MLFQLEALHNNIRTTVVVTTKHVEVPNNRIELITLIKNDKGGTGGDRKSHILHLHCL